MALRKFTITSAPGRTEVVVDGIATDPQAIMFEAHPREIPRLVVEYGAEVVLDGEGEVLQVRDPSPAEVLAASGAWLRTFDAATLRQEVEQRSVTLRSDPFKIALEVLAELAEEAANGA